MTMRTSPLPTRRPALILAALCALLALPLLSGCGAGGGSSSTSDSGGGGTGVTGVLSGYVYVPIAALGLAPGHPAPAAPGALVSPVRRAAPSGYIALSNAVVQLVGTTKATITSTEGYFAFNLTPSDNISTYAKVTITKPDVNISIEFETQVVAGMNKIVQIEVSTSSGETWVKELNPGGQAGADFVYVTGRVETSTGLILAAASVTATLTTDAAVRRTATADAAGIYKIVGLSEGTWRITAGRTGYRSAEKTVTVSPTYTLTNIDFILSGTFDIYDLLATKFTGQTTTLEYMTSVPTVTQIEYGITPSYGSVTPQESSYVNTHSVTLAGLSINTTYHYRVKAKDTNDNQVYSADQTFTTTDGTTQDTTPPEINTWTVTKTHNSIKVVFTLSKTSYGRIEYGTSRAAMVQTKLSGPSTTISATVSDLTPDTTYYIDLLGINIFDTNQITRLSLDPVKTDATPDTTPPVVTGTRVTKVMPTSAQLAWETVGELSNSQIYFGFVPGPAFDATGKTATEIENYLASTYSNKTAFFDENPLVSAHTVPIADLMIEKTYYARAVSRDPAGNPGIAAAEVSFTTPRPGTTFALATTTENPPAGSIAVGETFTCLSAKVTGSDTEAVSLTRLVFRNSGTATGADFDSIQLVRSGFLPVNGTLSGGTITFEFASSTMAVALEGEAYFTLAIKMKESAIGKTVLLGVEDKARITAVGDTYGQAAEAVNAFPFNANAFGVTQGALALAAGGSTTETTLNVGLSDVTVLEFDISALYEDVYVDKIQIQQTSTNATSNEFVNVRLFHGTQPLATTPPASTMEFLSSGATGLIAVPKGATRSLSIVINIPPSAVQGRALQFRVLAGGLTGRGRYSNLVADVSGDMVIGSKYTLGQSAVTVSAANEDPTAQIFVTGDTQKSLFAFTITAGGAEDVNITRIAVAQGGTADSGTITDFHLVADNQTKATAAFVSPETVFENANGLLYILKGTSKVVTVYGNINAVAGRTIQLSVAAAGKVQGTGATSGTTKTSEGVASGSTHIVAGRMQALNAASTPSGTLVLAGKERPLLNFSLKAVGEAVKVQTIYVRAEGDTFNNALIVSNLSLSDEVNLLPYTNPDVTDKGYAFNVNGALEIASGASASFKLYGDVGSSTAFVGKQVKYALDEGRAVATGTASNNQFTSLYKVEGNALTITLGSLAVSSTATVVPNATLVAGTTAAEIVGGFTLTAGAAENVTVEKLVVFGEGFYYGAAYDLDDLKLYLDGTTLVGTAVKNGGNYEFTPASTLTVNASAAKTFTLKAQVPAVARSGVTGQFKINTAGYIRATGVLSGLPLTPTGTALSPAFGIITGGMSVAALSTNPPDTDYPKNTTAELEFLRFRVAVNSVEGVTPSTAIFTRTVYGDIDMLAPASFALRLYDANGKQTQYAWDGADVTVAGPTVTFALASPALDLDAGTTDCELRLFARFDPAKATPGNTAKVDLASGGIAGVTALSVRSVTASGTVAGNTMSIVDVADTTAPVIASSPALAAVALQNSATVTWTTDEPASSKVYYRETGATAWTYETAEYDSATRVTAHSVALSGLKDAQQYQYKVRSVDAAGNAVESGGTTTFTTTAALLGELTASLAADTPAAANVLAGGAVTFLKVKLAATDDASNAEDVKVTSIKFTKKGSAATAYLGSLTLSDGDVTHTASLSGSTVTFQYSDSTREIFTVRKGQSLTLTLAGSTGATAGGETAVFTVAAASDIRSVGSPSGTSLTAQGTYPFPAVADEANYTMSFISGALTLSQVAAGTANNPLLPGATSVTLLEFNLATDADEAVAVNKITLTQLLDAVIDGATPDLWGPLHLRDETGANVSGVPSGASLVFGTGDTAFFTLPAGTTRKVSLIGNVSGGAEEGRMAQFKAAAATVLGRGVSTGVAVTAGGVDVSGSSFIIGSSSLAVAPALDNPASTVFLPGSATGVTFARINVSVGSAERLTTSKVDVALAGTAVDATHLDNLKLFDGQVEHTLTHGGGIYTTAGAIVLEPQKTYVWTVKGDVIGSAAGQFFTLAILPDGITATGAVTGATDIKSTGTATSSRHYLAGNLVVASNGLMPVQASDTYVAGSGAAYPIWEGQISAQKEDAVLTSLGFTLDSGSASDLTGLFVQKVTGGIVNYPTYQVSGGRFVFDLTGTPLTLTTAASPFAFIVFAKFPVDKNDGGTATIGSAVKLSLAAADVKATGAASGQAVSVAGDLAGNPLELKKGALAVSLDAGSPAAGGVLIDGATTDQIEARFKIAAAAAETLVVRSVTVAEGSSARYGPDYRDIKLDFSNDGGSNWLATTYTLTGPAGGVFTFDAIQVAAADYEIATGENRLFRIRASTGTAPAVGQAVTFAVVAGGVKARGKVSAGTLAAGATNVLSTGSATSNALTLSAGTLKVSSDTRPAFQAAYENRVNVGTQGVELFRFDLAAGNGSGDEVVRIDRVAVTLNGAAEHFTSFTLKDDHTTPETIQTIPSASTALVFESFVYDHDHDAGVTTPAVDYLEIPKGGSRSLTLTANVAPGAPVNGNFSFEIDTAGAVSGVGQTSGLAVRSTGTAVYTGHTFKKRTLAVAPAEPIPANEKAKPGVAFPALKFTLSAGGFEPLGNLKVYVTREGSAVGLLTMTVALFEGSSDAGLKVVDYTAIAVERKELSFDTLIPGYTLAADATKTYTLYAKPDVMGSPQADGATFKLSLAAEGDVTALGAVTKPTVADTAVPVLTGYASGATHKIGLTRVTVSTNGDTPAGSQVNRYTGASDLFEALRFDLISDGTAVGPLQLTELNVLNDGAALTTTHWEVQGLHDAAGNLLLSPLVWSCQGGAPTWLISDAFTALAAGSVSATYVVKAKALAAAPAGTPLKAQVPAIDAADFVMKERLPDGTLIDVTIGGTATGNLFRVRPGKATFGVRDDQVLKTTFFAGDELVAQAHVCAVFEVSAEDYENLTVSKLHFNAEGLAYGTDYSNARVCVLSADGLTNTDGTYDYLLDTNFDLTHAVVQSGNTISVELDGLEADDATEPDPFTVTASGKKMVAFLADFPDAAGQKSLQLRLTGLTAVGATSGLAVATPAPVTAKAISIKKSRIRVETVKLELEGAGTNTKTYASIIPIPPAVTDHVLSIFRVHNDGSAAAAVDQIKFDYSAGSTPVYLKDFGAVNLYNLTQNGGVGQLNLDGSIAAGNTVLNPVVNGATVGELVLTGFSVNVAAGSSVTLALTGRIFDPGKTADRCDMLVVLESLRTNPVDASTPTNIPGATITLDIPEVP